MPALACGFRWPLYRSLLPPITGSHRAILHRPHVRLKSNGKGSSDSGASLQSSFSSGREAHSIPGPAWLWLEPVKQPFRAYGRAQRRRPYLVQFLSSLTIYFLGDLSAQKVSQPAEQEEEAVEPWVYDPGRALRALTIGGISSIPSYRWFIWLGENFNYQSKFWSLAVKVVISQMVFTPVFNSYFFGMQSLLTGASLPETWERIKNTVPRSWVNSCKFWPPVTAFIFAFVPLEYRSIFAGVIAIGWQTYLSMLNQRAAQAEKEARMRGSTDAKSQLSDSANVKT